MKTITLTDEQYEYLLVLVEGGEAWNSTAEVDKWESLWKALPKQGTCYEIPAER